MANITSFRDLVVWQKTQVKLGQRVRLVTEHEAAAIIADAAEVGRMLHGLIGSLERTRH